MIRYNNMVKITQITHIHACTHAHSYTHRHRHTQTHTHTHTHIHTHARSHKHAPINIPWMCMCNLFRYRLAADGWLAVSASFVTVSERCKAR